MSSDSLIWKLSGLKTGDHRPWAERDKIRNAVVDEALEIIRQHSAEQEVMAGIDRALGNCGYKKEAAAPDVEGVAIAMFEAAGHDPSLGWETVVEFGREQYRTMAKAAIAAIMGGVEANASLVSTAPKDDNLASPASDQQREISYNHNTEENRVMLRRVMSDGLTPEEIDHAVDWAYAHDINSAEEFASVMILGEAAARYAESLRSTEPVSLKDCCIAAARADCTGPREHVEEQAQKYWGKRSHTTKAVLDAAGVKYE